MGLLSRRASCSINMERAEFESAIYMVFLNSGKKKANGNYACKCYMYQYDIHVPPPPKNTP